VVSVERHKVVFFRLKAQDFSGNVFERVQQLAVVPSQNGSILAQKIRRRGFADYRQRPAAGVSPSADSDVGFALRSFTRYRSLSPLFSVKA